MTTTTNTKQTTSVVSTAIPYVNAAPHLGFVLEAVAADALARHRRLQGYGVHHCSGTDDNSLKNARAAERLGVPTRSLVGENAGRFESLADLLNLTWDAFVRTSENPTHQQTVEELWRRCDARGDIYKSSYDGLYCVGCEQFYAHGELREGLCPEHGTEPEHVEEENYFFRLSRYADVLYRLVSTGQIRIVPEQRRNEVLRLIEGGLQDFSISRSRKRARDWGIAVPGDPSQIVYVWFDALTNYVSSLGDDRLERWERAARIEHVIGKGILRFHAVYWPAILLSAGLRLPTDVLVHGYLTVEGRKIGKSLGNAVDPESVVNEFGIDAVRYFLLRHVHTTRDGDFSRERLVTAHDAELADQLGNLVHRTTSLVGRYRQGFVPQVSDPREEELKLIKVGKDVAAEVPAATERFALHEALHSIWQLVAAGNRYVDRTEPWVLGRAEQAGPRDPRLDLVLYTLVQLVSHVGRLLKPFLPGTAEEILRRLGGGAPGTKVVCGKPLFPKQRWAEP